VRRRPLFLLTQRSEHNRIGHRSARSQSASQSE
jgi:hypothetical protein